MSGCRHEYTNPIDVIGMAVLHDDGQTLSLVEGLSPELTDVIHTTSHRIIVSVQFVADSERLIDENGDLL